LLLGLPVLRRLLLEWLLGLGLLLRLRGLLRLGLLLRLLRRLGLHLRGRRRQQSRTQSNACAEQ
jgi:hypothetical protein